MLSLSDVRRLPRQFRRARRAERCRAIAAAPESRADAEDLLRPLRAPSGRDERRASTARPSAYPASWCPARYFQVLGVGAAARTRHHARRRQDARRRVRRRPQLRLLAHPLRRRSGDCRPTDSRSTTTRSRSLASRRPASTGWTSDRSPSVRVPVMLKAQMTPNWDDVDNRRSRWVNVFGRLKPGVTREQALAAHPAVLSRPARAGSADAGVQRHDDVHTRAVPQRRDRVCCRGAGTIADSTAARQIR